MCHRHRVVREHSYLAVGAHQKDWESVQDLGSIRSNRLEVGGRLAQQGSE